MFARVWDEGRILGFNLYEWSLLFGGLAAAGCLLVILI